MDPRYVRAYRALYERHWWWRAREALILSLIRRWAGDRRDLSILDVGCGDGLLFDALGVFGDVEGVEADAGAVSGGGPHRGRIHVVPFDEGFRPERRYDLVLMLDVLEHLADPAAALRRAEQLLEAEGRLVITVPAFRVLWTGHDLMNRHETRFTKRSLRPLLEGAGLDVVTARYFFHWCFPAKLAVRLKEAVLRTPPRPARVPPEWINGALWGLCRLEQRLFTGLPLPFGSSLLAVGRRRSS